MSRLRLLLVAAAALLVAIVVPSAGVLVAHSGLEAARPGPDAVVGGEITEITLFYGDFITGIDGSVTGPDGQAIEAVFRTDSDIQATVTLSASLAVPGDYTVEHNVASIDGDRVESSYSFTFDPTALPPQLVFVPEESGTSWVVWAAVGIGTLAIVVAAWRLAGSLRKSNLRS